MKISNLKKLNIHEIWRLYQLISPQFKYNEKYSLIEFSERLMKDMNNQRFIECLNLMYYEISDNSPAHLATLFVWGMKETNFLSFMMFIERMKNA